MGGELIELEKNAGYQAVLTYLQDYTRKVRDIQEKYAFETREVMSPRLIDNPKLSMAERATLEELKRNLDRIIQDVAERVEKHRVVSYDDYTQKYELNAYDRLRINALVSSVRDINKSIQKIRFAFETFSRCNKYIINQLEECIKIGDYTKSKMFVLGNVMLIYELSNYLINFLENFKIDGIEEINKLYDNELNKINETMRNLEKLKEDANLPVVDDIDAKVKEQVISNLNDREKALEEFKKQWDEYIKGIHDLQEKVGNIMAQIPTLKLIRDNAQNQLDFFEIMKMFGIMMIAEAVKRNLDVLIIDKLPLHEIELISLPPHKVYTLIGLSREHGTSQTG